MRSNRFNIANDAFKCANKNKQHRLDLQEHQIHTYENVIWSMQRRSHTHTWPCSRHCLWKRERNREKPIWYGVHGMARHGDNAIHSNHSHIIVTIFCMGTCLRSLAHIASGAVPCAASDQQQPKSHDDYYDYHYSYIFLFQCWSVYIHIWDARWHFPAHISSNWDTIGAHESHHAIYYVQNNQMMV